MRNVIDWKNEGEVWEVCSCHWPGCERRERCYNTCDMRHRASEHLDDVKESGAQSAEIDVGGGQARARKGGLDGKQKR